jgi:hypothetical protein
LRFQVTKVTGLPVAHQQPLTQADIGSLSDPDRCTVTWRSGLQRPQMVCHPKGASLYSRLRSGRESTVRRTEDFIAALIFRLVA